VKTAETLELTSFRYATDAPSLGWFANSMVWTIFIWSEDIFVGPNNSHRYHKNQGKEHKIWLLVSQALFRQV
jgi:hypothetical protein